MSKLSELREKNIALAKKAVRESVNPDIYIINAINNIEELQKIINNLAKRLREWYSVYFPELDKKIEDHETYVTLILKKEKKALLKELRIVESMGYELEKKDLEPTLKLAKIISDLIMVKDELEDYLKATTQESCPNILRLCGAPIGAKLLRGAGSLKKLAMMRSSTIQLLGAEKALFRHIKTGAKPPKYGYLLQHQLVQTTKKADRGKVARALADKIFLAARVDYFKGEFIADELLEELEVRFK